MQKEYKILYYWTLDGLTDMVNAHLKDGWDIAGDITVVPPPGGGAMRQGFAIGMSRQMLTTDNINDGMVAVALDNANIFAQSLMDG